MPTPKKDETRDEFLTRCMTTISDEDDKKDWTKEHKLGFCFGLWKNFVRASMDKYMQAVVKALYGLDEEDVNGTKD
jgi:hypothetical protein